MAIGSAVMPVIPSLRGMSAVIEKEVGRASVGAGKSAGKGVSGGILGAVKGATGPMAAMLAGAGAVGFLKEANAEAREGQKVGAVTTQIIKATGGAAKVTSDQVGSLATAISNKSGMDDEAIQSGANLLLTFKNVRNEAGAGGKIFDRATQSAVDLSAAGFGSVEGASKMLGKALNDPVKGISALGRAGVTFTDQQKNQIKTLVASGNTLGAQKVILAEVEGQVGGVAAKSATAGEKMAVAFGNFKEQVGTALLPIIDRVATVITTRVLPALSGFLTQMQSGTGAGGRFVSVLRSAGGALMSLTGFVVRNRAVIVPLVAVLGTAVGIIKTVSLVTRGWAVAQGVLNLALTANPIGLVVVAIAGLAAGLVIAYKKSETFRNVVNGVFSGVKRVAVGAVGAIKAGWDRLPSLLLAPVRLAKAGLNTAWGAITSRFTAAKNWVLGAFRAGWATLQSVIVRPVLAARNALSRLLDGVRRLFSNAVASIGRVWDGIVARISGPVHTVINMIRKIPGLGKVADPAGYATGTNSAGRGLAMVGERGPELVDFGRGGQKVYNNRDSQRMLAGGRKGGDVNLHIYNAQAEPTSTSIAAAASYAALAR